MPIRQVAAITTTVFITLAVGALIYGLNHKPQAVLEMGRDDITARAFQPGAFVKLVTFRTSSKPVTLWTIAGNLRDSSIDPSDQWQQRFAHANGVDFFSSVDEEQSTESLSQAAVAYYVSKGCDPPSGYLQLGTTASPSCTGPYRNLGITRVINAAIVTHSDRQHKDSEACRDRFKNDDPGYQKCVQDAVVSSLSDYFQKLRVSAPAMVPSSVVIPALGTGNGKMDKDRFYEAARWVLLDALSRPDRMPDNIYLFIWPEKDQGKRSEIADSIARHVQTIIIEWNDKALGAQVETSPFFLSGVAFALAGISFVVLLRPTGIGAQLAHVSDGSEFLEVCVGWFVAGFGTASAIEPRWVTGSVLFMVTWGVLCTLAAQYLLVARRSFENAVSKSEKPSAQVAAIDG